MVCPVPYRDALVARRRRHTLRSMQAAMRAATAGLTARRIMMASVPQSSVVSVRMDVPPAASSISEARPRAGFAASPEKASVPPHLRPNRNADNGQGSRFRGWMLFASSCARAIPLAMALQESPSS